MKTCPKCQTDKPFDAFPADKKRKDGLYPHCRACCKAYYEANKQRINQRNNQYYAENKSAISATRQVKRDAQKQPKQLGMFKHDDLKADYNFRYQREHRDELRTQKARYIAANIECVRKRWRNYRLRNLDKKQQYQKEWQKKNADRIRIYSSRRRAWKRQSDGNYTHSEWQLLKELCRYACLCCGKREPEITLTPDHVVPLCKGGSNGIENIQPLCLSCNCTKKDKTIDYRH